METEGRRKEEMENKWKIETDIGKIEEKKNGDGRYEKGRSGE
jgi:hypothetical protein